MVRIPVHAVPSSVDPATTGGENTALAAELDKAKARIAELESVEAITARRHEELLREVKQRAAKEIKVWEETSGKNADSLIINVKVVKAGSVKISVEWNLILVHFKKRARVLQDPLTANVERKITLTEAILTARELLERCRSIDNSDYSAEISKGTQDLQRQTVQVKSKDFEMQTIPGLVEGAGRLLEVHLQIKRVGIA